MSVAKLHGRHINNDLVGIRAVPRKKIRDAEMNLHRYGLTNGKQPDRRLMKTGHR